MQYTRAFRHVFGRNRVASQWTCRATSSSTMQQQQPQQQQQKPASSSSNRRKRGGGGKSEGSKGPGYAPASSATPGHLGGGRPQQQQRAGGGPAHAGATGHQHTMQHTPTHQHQHVHPMPHAREPHVGRGQQQQGVPQQQQHQPAGQHRQMQTSAPSNTSALSGVMFASLRLHPATLSGLHVSGSCLSKSCVLLEIRKAWMSQQQHTASLPESVYASCSSKHMTRPSET